MKERNGLILPQDRETPVQVGRRGGFAWRCAYSRAAETRKAGDLGQDFLAFLYDDSTFAFAVCDGVGQSFFGELASSFLGNALINWLWQDLPGTMDVEAVR